MELLTWISQHWLEVLNAGQALLLGVIAICLLIPGEQPEKALQSVVDFIKKLSVK